MKPKNKPRKMRLNRQNNKKRSINRFTIRYCELIEKEEVSTLDYSMLVYGYEVWWI